MKQVLIASKAEVLGTWSDGSAAVTVRELGKGKAYAVGTAAGLTHLKTAVRPVPWARGGYVNLYNPTEFAPTTTKLIQLAVADMARPREVQCSSPYVEAQLLDNNKGTLITLVNWTNDPKVTELSLSVQLRRKPTSVFSVEQQKELAFEYRDGTLSFKTTLTEADFVKVMR